MVGVNAREIKWKHGYQYQCYKNIVNPIIVFYLSDPSLVVRVIVAFLPAAFIIPYEIIAPILLNISSCLSLIIFEYNFLIVETFYSYFSVT